jgi:hypothetical protein
VPIQNATAKKWIGLVGSELFLEFEATREKAAQFIGAGLGFDLLLKRGELFFHAAIAENVQAILGVIPCRLGDRLEKDFEKQAAFSFFESRGQRGGVRVVAYFCDQEIEEALAFEASVERVMR